MIRGYREYQSIWDNNWQMETYSVNEKFTQSTGQGYQEKVDGTPAASNCALPKKYLPINSINIHLRLY